VCDLLIFLQINLPTLLPQVAPRDRARLLASAALLARRLEKRGRKVTRGGASAAGDSSGYAAAQVRILTDNEHI